MRARRVVEPGDHFGSAVSADAHDPEELRDWCDALDRVLAVRGPQLRRERGVMLLDALLAHARQRKLAWPPNRSPP
jgi:hypothetical protein